MYLYCLVELKNCRVDVLRLFEGYFEAIDNFFNFMIFLQNNRIEYNCSFISDDYLSDTMFDSYMNSDVHLVFCFQCSDEWCEI